MITKRLETILATDHKPTHLIGRYHGTQPGPTVVAIGSLHGNEKSGARAIGEFLEEIKRRKPRFQGTFVGISGNLKALQQGMRYIDRDLNRMWQIDIETEKVIPPGFCAELDEFEEITKIVEQTIAEANGPLIFADLHTTSANSIPFVLIGDTIRNRKFVSALSVPVILGLEEQLNGPLLSLMNLRGHISMGFEGGQHEDPVSRENHISVLWAILAKAGCISPEENPEIKEESARLKKLCGDLRKTYEVRYRHGIKEQDQFKMKPGYLNFQKIREGEVLANDLQGKVRARENGNVFMPLYQNQGDDGFFIIREIAPFWLGFSRVLRYLQLQKVLPLLPGIKKHPRIDSALVMNTQIARWFGLELFHLLGYRKISREGAKMLLIKRKFDLKTPIKKG